MPDRRPNWRAGETAAQAARKTANPKRGKIIAVVFVMLALAGAIAALVLYPRAVPEPYFEAVWIDEYKDTRIPVNAWAAPDRTAFLRSVRWQEANAFTLQARHLLVQELTTLRTKADRPLVVYLCAYAVGIEDGGVWLLPGDAKLDDPKSWLPLDEVLRYLRDCPSPQKLLLLDIAQPFVDPRAGVLANDVADRLKPVVEAAVKDDPRLLVLCSCSPGQVPWTSEDLGHSVFAYYALLGLQGRADGWHGAKDDARISAQELISYVMFHVDRWSRDNRKTPQTPLFIGANLDLPLVPAGARASPTVEESEAVYPPKLQAGWKVHDDWWSSGTYQRLPEVFRQMQAALLRAEQRWRGGVEAAKVESDLKPLMDRWEQHRKDSASPITSLAPRSLAEAVARGQKPPALTGAVLQKLRDLAELDARVRGPKPEDKDKAKLAMDREAFLKLFEGRSFDLAYTIFQVAANETNPRSEQVRFWTDLLRSIKPPVRYVETEFLLHLEKLADDSQNWSAKAAHFGLQMVRDAETALAGDREIMPWVRALIDDAQRRRQQDETEFFTDEVGPREQFSARLRDTGHAFQVILRNMKNVADGHRLRDQALLFLPTYPSYLELNAADEPAWLNAIQNTRALATALAAPPSRSTKFSPEFFKQVGDLAEALQENLRQLRQPFTAARVKAALDQAKHDGPAGWHELNGLLDSPWLSSGDRVTVWKAVREIPAGLQKKTAEVDQANDEAAKGKARPTFDGERATQQEWTRALQRARWSIELLKLEGRPEAPELEKLVHQAVKEPVRGPASQALARGLRQAWSQPPPVRD